MNRNEFEQKQYEMSVNAQMNQLYHQRLAQWWKNWNRFVQICVAVLAVIGVCVAVAAAFVDDYRVDIGAIFVGSLAALFAIALNVLPLGDWATEHTALLRQWSDVREDVDALEFELAGNVTPELVSRLRSLDGKMHRICGGEPGMDESLRDDCFNAAEKSRQPAGSTHG